MNDPRGTSGSSGHSTWTLSSRLVAPPSDVPSHVLGRPVDFQGWPPSDSRGQAPSPPLGACALLHPRPSSRDRADSSAPGGLEVEPTPSSLASLGPRAYHDPNPGICCS
ncbi:hypothetical protein KM043_001158 [Ampulex compressa]|nr:hypothetical protein KM043_001158 [Ampulex compressa]